MKRIITHNGTFNITNALYESIRKNNPELLEENDPSFAIFSAYDGKVKDIIQKLGLNQSEEKDLIDKIQSYERGAKDSFGSGIIKDGNEKAYDTCMKYLDTIYNKYPNKKDFLANFSGNYDPNFFAKQKNQQDNEQQKNQQDNSQQNDVQQDNSQQISLANLIGNYHDQIQKIIEDDNDIDDKIKTADDIYNEFHKEIKTKINEIINNGRSDNISDEDKKYIKSKYMSVISKFYNDTENDDDDSDDTEIEKLKRDYYTKIQNKIKEDEDVDDKEEVIHRIKLEFNKLIKKKIWEIEIDKRENNLTDEDKEFIESKYNEVIEKFVNDKEKSDTLRYLLNKFKVNKITKDNVKELFKGYCKDEFFRPFGPGSELSDYHDLYDKYVNDYVERHLDRYIESNDRVSEEDIANELQKNMDTVSKEMGNLLSIIEKYKDYCNLNNF